MTAAEKRDEHCLDSALDSACRRIAPAWPLDQWIAVNPWWEMRQQPYAEVAARLAALGRAHCLMPGGYFSELAGTHVMDSHLRRAAAELGVEEDVAALKKHVEGEGDATGHWHNVSDLLDSARDREHRMAWRDEVTHQISQFCASFFQQGGDGGRTWDNAGALYRQWLYVTRRDPGIEILMGEPGLTHRFEALPDDPDRLLHAALSELKVGADVAADYAHALLLDINGWASWIAYLRWQAGLEGQEHRQMRELLAIRMAWDLALWRHQARTDTDGFRRLHFLWRQQLANVPNLITGHRSQQRLAWVWQRAAELAYQETLHRKLRQPSRSTGSAPVQLQAVFCIDVRSEVMRRALESQDPSIRTFGFAGFFGLPIEFQAAGSSYRRPQLPGLLKPTLRVVEGDSDPALGEGRRRMFNRRARRSELGEAPPATFSLVEATGLSYAFKLIKDSFFAPDHQHPLNGACETGGWTLRRNGQALSTTEKTDLAAGVLHAMGLEGGFAPAVLLVGHGSTSRNNPHAAGLDCGACGGQTGEVNVRVLAQILNDPQVRDALRAAGTQIPETTGFIAALHDTTTDEITLFDRVADSGKLRRWLQGASAQARQERAGALGLNQRDGDELARTLKRRSRDWSQVRPEWGLANNAAFIVAPRERTRGVDLEGRVFLHDYCWREDPDFGVLELIMTAPMVVTNWINMQYNASVADNLKYGSGSKVLHNVVGGHLGVFEGNGGDLRIGLSMQSLHDGRRWMHQPLRLSVYIAAPRAAIAGITARHAVVKDLVDNDWLYLFRLDDDGSTIERYYRGDWLAEAADPGTGIDESQWDRSKMQIHGRAGNG